VSTGNKETIDGELMVITLKAKRKLMSDLSPVDIRTFASNAPRVVSESVFTGIVHFFRGKTEFMQNYFGRTDFFVYICTTKKRQVTACMILVR